MAEFPGDKLMRQNNSRSASAFLTVPLASAYFVSLRNDASRNGGRSADGISRPSIAHYTIVVAFMLVLLSTIS